MKCTEDGCSGEINTEDRVALMVGCMSKAVAYPCVVCGRLHWPDGSGVMNRQEHAAFLENGRVVNKDADGKVMSTL